MATWYTLRPDQDHVIQPGWANTSPNVWNKLRDDDDGTYIWSFCCGNPEVEIGYGTLTMINQRVGAIRLVSRIRGTSPTFDYNIDTWLRSSAGDGGGASYYGPNEPWGEWINPWWYRDWSQSELDNIHSVHRANTTAGTTTPSVSQSYIQIIAQDQPIATINSQSSPVSLNPTLTWTNNWQNDAAKYYQIHVRRNSDWALVYNYLSPPWTNATSHQVTGLQPGVGYTFHVSIATDFVGGGEYWSNWSSFSATTNSAPSVNVISPTGLTGTTPTIVWTYSDPNLDAQTKYRVRVFSQAQYTAGGFNPDSSTSSWDSGDVNSAATSVVTGTLVSGTTYRAYVKAADSGSGQFGSWSFIGFTATHLATATLLAQGDIEAASLGASIAEAEAELTNTESLVATAFTPLCLFPYIAYVYGGALFCDENLGDFVTPVDQNILDLCIVQC